MKGDFHVRFCENTDVKFICVTRLSVRPGDIKIKETVKIPDKSLSTFPTLTTKRLTLRQPVETDVQEIFLLRTDMIVNKYLDREPGETLEEAPGFIKKVTKNFSNNNGFYWAITDAGNKKLIGIICLFNFSDELKICKIGYELLPDYQGQGIMNEALEKLLNLLFTHSQWWGWTLLLIKTTKVQPGFFKNLILRKGQ